MPRRAADPRGSAPSRRDQIRQAAYRCFRDRGYHETSVDDICREASISKGSLYWHYESKQDVFLDILESWANQVMEELYQQFELSLGHEDYLEVITHAVQREMHRGRVLIPLWLDFTLHARRDREVQIALSKFFRRSRVAIAEILAPVLGSRLSDEELRGTAAVIFGAYTGLLVQELTDPEQADAQRALGDFMSVLGRWIRSLQQTPPREGKPARTTGRRIPGPELGSFLALEPEGVRQRVHALRDLVNRAVPGADERLIRGWKVLGWGAPRLFCTVKPLHDGVRMAFPQGRDLPDPGGLLGGTGKRARHVDLPLETDLDAGPLQDLVWEAARRA